MSIKRIFPTWQLNEEESQVSCSLNLGLFHSSEARAHSKKHDCAWLRVVSTSDVSKIVRAKAIILSSTWACRKHKGKEVFVLLW